MAECNLITHDSMALVSITEYARRRGVARNAVVYQIDRGIIERTSHGMVDTEQADAAWTPPTSSHSPDTERRKRQADLTAQMVKFNLGTVQRDRLQQKYIERSHASEVVLGEVDGVLHMLRSTPQRYSSTLAAEMQVDQAIAETILERVVSTILQELGDIRADAERTIERL
jgi:hypothetical protein